MARTVTPRGHVLDCVRALPRKLASSRLLSAGARPGAVYVPVDLARFMPDLPYDQEQEGACTAHMIVALACFLRARLGLAYTMLSRQFQYFNERDIEGTTADDAGASIPDSFQATVLRGICPESDWPYTPADMTQKPTDQAYADALANLFLATAAVAHDQASLYACLCNGLPVGVGIAVMESFESDAAAASGIIPMPGPGEQLLGRHAILIVGLVQVASMDNAWYWKFRNSWGTAWGDGGYGYLPLAYLLDRNLTFDPMTASRIGPAPAPAAPRLAKARPPNGIGVLIVGGLTERIGDGSPIWALGPMLTELGFEVTLRQWDTLQGLDLSGKRLVVNYSWGKAATERCRKLVTPPPGYVEATIAGVPCPLFGQFDLFGNSYWIEAPSVVSAVNYSLSGMSNFPVDKPIQNPSASFLNVDITGPGANHLTAPALPAVVAGILAQAQALLAE